MHVVLQRASGGAAASGNPRARLFAAVCEALERRTLLSGGIAGATGGVRGSSSLFSTNVDYTVGGGGTNSGLVTDVNGDGNLDIVTADYGGKISILAGNGDGTFKPATRISDGLPNGPATILALDLHDGGSSGDAASLLIFSGNEASLLVANGNGTFAPPQIVINSPSFINDIAVGDFNTDGQPDLAVGYSNNTINVLFEEQINNGVGFSPIGAFSTGANQPDSIRTADFNDDGITDLAVANSNGDLDIYFGNSDGTFTQPTTVFHTTATSFGFDVGDANNDGQSDLLIGDNTGKITILLGNGDGTFHAAPRFTVSSNLNGAAVADFNGDGNPDVMLTSAGNNFATLLVGNGDGTFAQAATYSVGNGPTDIIAADLNGDGKPDVVTINAAADSVSVLLNATPATNGTSLHQPVTYPAGNKPRGVAIGDVNGDGNPDLIVTNTNDNDIEIFPGNGDGTFGAPSILTGFNNPRGIAVADLNGDGNLDLIVTSYSNGQSSASYVSVAMGNGNGTFKTPVSYELPISDSGGGNGNDVAPAVGDVNGDGRPDIAVVNPATDQLFVFINNGNGTFGAPESYYTRGISPSAVAIGDLNGDGDKDIVVADAYSSSVELFINTGNDGFSDGGQLHVGGNPNSVAIADLNGDGNADIITGNNGNYYASGGTASVSVLLGLGSGTFAPAKDIALPGNRAGDVVVSDITGDGKPDLVVATGYQSAGVDFLNLLAGNGDGTFKAPVGYAVASAPDTVVAGDVNRDGRPDIVTTDQDHGEISVLLNTGAGGFFGGAKTVPLPGSSSPESVATGDFNGDGKADMVVANQTNGLIQVFLGNGDGTFQAPRNYYSLPHPTSVIVGDLNGDGKLDIIEASSTQAKAAVFLGNGDGSFQSAIQITLPSIPSPGPDAIAVADVNGDGKLDLIVANGMSGSISILLGNGTGHFTGGSTLNGLGANSDVFAVAAADVTGDNHPDIEYTDAYNEKIGILVNNSDGTFKAPRLYSTGLYPTSIAVGHLTGDGNEDLVVADKYSNNVAVLLGNGNGSFAAPRFFAAGNDPFQAVISDVNGDGNPDILAVDPGNSDYRGNQLAILLGNGAGGFASGTYRQVGNYPRSLAVADFNGDGNPDVLVVNGVDNSASIFLNNGVAKIMMGGGNMVSVAGGGGDDNVNVNYSNGTVTINIDGQSQSYSAAAVNGININLGAGNDSLMLNAGVPAVTVNGGAGNDTIMAMNGGDNVNGGGGQDMLVAGDSAGGQIGGGAGNDTVMGGGNNTMLTGNAGNDMIDSGHHKESVSGGAGNDTISGAGHDSLRGGAGDNLFLDGNNKKDSIDGGTGLSFAQNNPSDSMTNIFQVIDPTPPVSAATATPAADSLVAPADTALVVTAAVSGTVLEITGTHEADDIEVTSDGTDLHVLVNGAPDSSIPAFPLAGLTGLSISGKGGRDTITVDSSVMLLTSLFGGAGGDSLTGGGGSNVIDGGGANDTLVGGGGTNLLIPGLLETFTDYTSGADVLIGGSGFTIADLSYRTDPMFLSNDNLSDSGDAQLGEHLTIMSSVSAIWGGTANDTIVGTTGGEFLSGGLGADSISGGGPDDLLVGGLGQDTVKVAAEPVTLYLQDGQADQYSGVKNPDEDILQLDAGLDVLTT